MNLIRVAVVALLLPLLLASPAHAHAGDAAEETNYRSAIDRIEPEIPGLKFEIVAGNQLRLTNETDVDALVLGYREEPYLRVGPDGVFANRRSPATYLNRTADADFAVPSFADPAAEPEWELEERGRTATWHDHRVHWMSDEDPPVVAANPDVRHIVIPEWKVNVVHGDRPVVITGHLLWIPPPSPAPWWALIAATFLLALASLVVPRPLTWMAVALAVAVAVDIVHVVGLALGSEGAEAADIAGALETALPAVVAWVTGMMGVRRLLDGTEDGVWLTVFASVLIGALGGAAHLSDFSHSQLDFALDPVVARVCVAMSLGLGAGLAGAGTVLIVRERRLRRAADVTEQ